MLRPRSRAAIACAALVLSLSLAACGSEDSEGVEGAGMEAVSIKGAFGKKANVTISRRLGAHEPEVSVLTKGDGATIKAGDTALAHWWVGNGYTRKVALDAFGGAPTPVPVGDDVFPGLRKAVEDHQVGSRVAVLAQAQDAFGEMGNPDIGIGNRDVTLIVVDIVGTLIPGPSGEDRPPAKWAPAPIESDGTVTGLDFSGAHRPKGNLLHTTLVKGDGPAVRKGQTVYVDYLGQVPGAKKSFVDTYASEPFALPLGEATMGSGLDDVLAGRTVGSRMVVEVPPQQGFGDKGRPELGIKGDDTMFFVVDILGAV